MSLTKIRLLVAGVAALGLMQGACSRPGGPGITDEFGDGGIVFISGIRCPAAQSSEPLPARSTVTMPSTSTSSGNIFFTDALYDRFRSICGGCHVDGNSGGFIVTKGTFPQLVTQDVISNYIESPDPTKYMPPMDSPNGKDYADRGPTDPVVELVGLLELWIQQGSPAGSFQLTPSGGDGGADADGGGTDGGEPVAAASSPPSGTAAQADYSISAGMSAQLTNIGTCIPSKYIVGLNAPTMDQLDTFFAQATALPATLAETDLITFDSDELARNGVISYTPAYPLWSDAAGKMRHVRAPHNQPITFDASTQQFHIPPNTRFYKTFLKHVIDASGNDAYKKIETRLIVSRPDQDMPDGTVQQTALFGTYVWDEAETTATLMTDPLRDGEPFSDRLISYITDEPRAAAIIATKPPNVDYVLEIENPGLVRHYAIPGSTRCIQCHMGSPSASFVLGFTPLQVATVPPGASGVIEPATGDELTQLKRLIDYKVVSGMTSPADVLPLEKTQLPRTPRNNYELSAQAYMVGNCAHCHNPRGFPSTKAPELKNVLDFLPGPNGGIFQFPLETTSPLRERGLQHDVPIPYITPSLRDYPATDEYSAVKYLSCVPGESDGWCTNPGQIVDFIDAPWRSLVYRNVDTPFDYVDDLTIFPHMPMNTPGYDCRVPQIMGDWMVSIPAVQVTPGDNEDAITSVVKGTVDTNPQPYAEVKPTDSGYAAALAAAQKRLASYHAGHRYNFCPDTTDIVDEAVLNRQLPSDPLVPTDNNVFDPNNQNLLVMPTDGVPDQPHWVVTDTSDPPGDWTPRRPDWSTALVDHMAVNPSLLPSDLANLQKVIDAINNVSLTDSVRQAVTAVVPFGVWKPKAGCNFAGIPTASSFQGQSRPLWMTTAMMPPDPNAPVYMQSRGAAVFTNICINCHGPEGDAKGLLADEISIMTGGDARVANFRIGLFGPADSPGANRQRVFSAPAVLPDTGSPDDYGARYMAWMALGGTQKQIPPALLQIVASTPVLGAVRGFTSRGTANMLQLAQQLCNHTLPADGNVDAPSLKSLLFDKGLLNLAGSTTDLIGDNGDTDNWLSLCALDNRQIVRVATVNTATGTWTANTMTRDLAVQRTSLYWADGYPSSAPVMNQFGQVVSGVAPDNLYPLCLLRPSDPTEAGYADAFRSANLVGGPGGNMLPYCPDALFATTPHQGGPATPTWQLAYKYDTTMGGNVYVDANDWATRGAINAGLAVFLYVDGLAKGLYPPQISYDRCDQLGGSSAP